MGTTADTGSLSQQILSLASELKARGSWMSVHQIQPVLQERGFEAAEIEAALSELEDGGFLAGKKRRGPGPLAFSDNAWEISEKGAKELRRLNATYQFNVRLPAAIGEQVRAYASRHQTTASAAAVRLMEEGLRMDRFPGVDFRWCPSGRQPFLTGTGLSVWELLRIWLDHGKDPVRVIKNYPSVSVRQIETAVEYAKAHGDEMPPAGFGVSPAFAKRVEV